MQVTQQLLYLQDQLQECIDAMFERKVSKFITKLTVNFSVTL